MEAKYGNVILYTQLRENEPSMLSEENCMKTLFSNEIKAIVKRKLYWEDRWAYTMLVL